MLSSDRISDAIEILASIREEIAELNRKLKDLSKQESEQQQQLMTLLEEHGMKRVSNNSYTVSINESQVPTVQDWDAFYQYIHDNNAAYLLERRPSTKPYRELLEQGIEVPGVVPFVRRTLSLRMI